MYSTILRFSCATFFVISAATVSAYDVFNFEGLSGQTLTNQSVVSGNYTLSHTGLTTPSQGYAQIIPGNDESYSGNDTNRLVTFNNSTMHFARTDASLFDFMNFEGGETQADFPHASATQILVTGTYANGCTTTQTFDLDLIRDQSTGMQLFVLNESFVNLAMVTFSGLGGDTGFSLDNLTLFPDIPVLGTLNVTVQGKPYTLTTIFGSYNRNKARLQRQPWWNKDALATQFAEILNDRLGLPHAGSGNFGPWFARDTSTFSQNVVAARAWQPFNNAATLRGIGPAERLWLSGNSVSRFQWAVTITDYDTWMETYPCADLNDPDLDHDGDGLSNWQEYLFALDPTNSGSLDPVTTELDQSAGTFSYQRRSTNLTDVGYSVWYSEDLVQWTEDTTVVQTPDAPVDDVENVNVTLSATKPLAAKSLFVQVRVK